MKENMIMTLRPLSRDGSYIPKDAYAKYRKFILGALENNGGMTLIELIDQAKGYDALKTDRELTWTLLQVKLDLQARERIKIKILPNRKQVIFLNRVQRKASPEGIEAEGDELYGSGLLSMDAD